MSQHPAVGKLQYIAELVKTGADGKYVYIDHVIVLCHHETKMGEVREAATKRLKPTGEQKVIIGSCGAYSDPPSKVIIIS